MAVPIGVDDTWDWTGQVTTDMAFTDLYDNMTDVYANDTVTPESLKDIRLYKAYNAMIAINSAFITLAMGAGVEFKDVMPNLRRPIGPAIGVFCQSILMPAICFAYAVALDLDSGVAIGMLITGSCPGGALSNIFTYWSRGDLTLSVVMTVVSTTLAIGFLPLNMFIYTRYWTDEDTVDDIPYGNMVFSMLYTWVAAAIGMVIAWKAKRAAKYVAKIGSFVGFLLMVVAGVLQSQVYEDLFVLDAETWIAGLTMPPIACIIGLSIASCFHRWLELPKRRAIAYETGVQNVAVALAVIALSFEKEESAEYNVIPMIYAFSSIVLGILSSLVHQMYFRHREGTAPFAKCPRLNPGLETDAAVSGDALEMDCYENAACDTGETSSVSMEPSGTASACAVVLEVKESSTLDNLPAEGTYTSYRESKSNEYQATYPS